MPPHTARTRVIPEDLWWAVCFHRPIPESTLWSDLWLVPFAIPNRTSRSHSFFCSRGKRARDIAVALAGEGPILNGYDPDTVEVSFDEGQARLGEWKDTSWTERATEVEVHARGKVGSSEIRDRVLVLLRRTTPLYVYQDTSQALSQQEADDVSGAHPFSYWQERDLHLYLDEAKICRIRYRLGSFTLAELRQIGDGPPEDVLDLYAENDDGWTLMEETVVNEGVILRDVLSRLPAFSALGEHGLPFGREIELPIRASRVPSELGYVNHGTELFQEIDLSPPRRRLVPRSAVFPTLVSR